MRLAGVLVVYTTAPVLALRGQHVAVDVFINLLPRLPRTVCLVIAELSVMLFSALTVYGGWLYLQRAWKFKTAALGLPNIYLYAPIMACFVLLFIISAWRVATIVRTERAMQ
ncbi:MAG: TRAP transporter small permease subunit, partial [Aliihoeflea sp.]